VQSGIAKQTSVLLYITVLWHGHLRQARRYIQSFKATTVTTRVSLHQPTSKMVSISASQAAAILAFLTTSVRGHMILGSPVPFDFAVENSKQAPLLADGSDFPCKFTPGFQPVQHTKNKPMAPGSTNNELSFIGGATHGGGSCQVSLTTDTVPTKNSKWEVIHSIEGGCPIDGQDNLSGNAQDTGSTKFTYPIPADMAAGKYTLAWTWFNKIGNREMYMNCAPIEIAGGAAKREITKVNKKRQSARPDMLRANIGNGCSTKETKNVVFPDPGASVKKVVTDEKQLAPPDGSCGATGAAPAGDASSNSSSSSSAAPAPAAPSAAAPSAAAPAAAESSAAAPGVFAEPSATGAAPAATATAAAAPAGGAPAPAAPAAGSGAGAACSSEGMYVCSPDGTSFTRCASGTMSAPMQMSAGTKCVPGQDPETLKMVAIKRAVRFGAEHAARSL
jgi:hypothetical protein